MFNIKKQRSIFSSYFVEQTLSTLLVILIWFDKSWVWLDFDWQNWIKVVNISSVLVHTKELIAIWKLLLLSRMLKNDAISKRLIYLWKTGEIEIRCFLSKMKRIMFLQLCSIENLVFFSTVISSSFYFPTTLVGM